MKNLHAVITGGLHTGNIGDHALAKAFVNQQKDNYQKLTILGEAYQDLLSIGETIISPPPMAIGYRFWYGHKQRIETRKKINEEMPDAIRDYIWLGGLLGHSFHHTKLRYQELKWASSFSEKLIYYFGDVGLGFENVVGGKKLVTKINSLNSLIAVRSTEAADLLIDAGLSSKVFVGIDAALYERCIKSRIPFIRQEKEIGAVAIVVCQYRSEQFIDIWRAAAVSAIKLNMKVLWISLCDSEDLSLCKQLLQEFSEKYPNYPMEIVAGINGERKIAEASVCVATRFHGAIFGITSGVPTIGLPYGMKIQRLFEFLNLEDWIADPTLKTGNNTDWNSILHEMIQEALAGKFQPDYSQLESGIKAHKEALADLDLFIGN